MRMRAALALLAVLAVGCASGQGSGSVGGGVTPNGRVVTVTQAQTGRVVSVHVGDTVRIFLGPPLGGMLSWQLRTYPKAVVKVLPVAQRLDRIDLLAVAAGRGTVTLVGSVRCGSPGPMAAGTAAAGVQCPVLSGGGGSTGSPGGMVPARQLSFIIAVSA